MLRLVKDSSSKSLITFDATGCWLCDLTLQVVASDSIVLYDFKNGF